MVASAEAPLKDGGTIHAYLIVIVIHPLAFAINHSSIHHCAVGLGYHLYCCATILNVLMDGYQADNK